MSRTTAAAVGLLVSLAGCNSTAAALPTLSVSNPAANARTIADVADRLCLRASTDPENFAAALRQTGWPSRKTQSADRQSTLAVWQLPHATLIYSERPIVAPDADVWTCTFVTDRAAAPPENLLFRILIHQLIGSAQSARSPLGRRWKPSLLAEADMDLAKGETGGVGVTIEYAQLKPFRALFGK